MYRLRVTFERDDTFDGCNIIEREVIVRSPSRGHILGLYLRVAQTIEAVKRTTRDNEMCVKVKSYGQSLLYEEEDEA